MHTDAGATTARAVVVAIPPAAPRRHHLRACAPGRVCGTGPSTGRRATSARPTPPTRRRSGARTAGPARHCPTTARVHHVRRQPQRPTAPASCWASPTRAPSTRCPRTRVASGPWLLRRAVRRRRPRADRLRRPLLGRRGIRAGRTDRGGATGVVDELRAHGCGEPVDGIFWAGTETADEWTGFLDGAVRSGHARRGRGRVLSGSRRYELIRRSWRTDSTSARSCALTSSGCSRGPQCPPVSSTKDARFGASAAMRRDARDRQQPVLPAADHQRRHREVRQRDVLGAKRIDECASPTTAARRRCCGEQVEDEVRDGGIGVAADRERCDETSALLNRTRYQRCSAELLQHRADGADPASDQRARHGQDLNVAKQITVSWC